MLSFLSIHQKLILMKKIRTIKTLVPVFLLTLNFITISCSKEDESLVVQQQEEDMATAQKLNESKAYAYVEKMPEFRGGEEAMFNFLGSNIEYPEAAKKARLEGLTVVSFVVEKDGSVTEISTVKNLSPETDQEAVRVVKLTGGNWIAGKQNGEPVRVRYTLPIRFAMK